MRVYNYSSYNIVLIMTDDVDIVQIDVDFFNELKQIFVEDDRIVAKVKLIIDAYACFKEVIPVSANIIKFVNHSHAYSGKTFNNKAKFQYQARPPRLVFNGKCDKDAMGLLNKMSPSNKDVIIQKLLRLCFQKENIDGIVNQVIDKCFRYKTYMGLFIQLLEEIRQRYPTDLQDAVVAFLNNFVDEFDTDLGAFRSEPSVDDYHEYCVFVKGKELFLSKLHLFLILASSYNPPFIQVLFGKFSQFIEREELTTLLCHMIVEAVFVIQRQNIATFNVQDILSPMMQKFELDKMMKKTAFKLQDILKQK